MIYNDNDRTFRTSLSTYFIYDLNNILHSPILPAFFIPLHPRLPICFGRFSTDARRGWGRPGGGIILLGNRPQFPFIFRELPPTTNILTMRWSFGRSWAFFDTPCTTATVPVDPT